MFKYLNVLKDFSVFKGLTVEEIWTFLSDCDYTIQEYNILDKIEPKENYIMFLIMGAVRETYTDYDDNKTDTNMYHYIGSNIITLDTYGDFYNLEYTAMVPSIVLFLSRKSLLHFDPKTAKIKNILYNNIIDVGIFYERRSDVIRAFSFQKGVRNKLLKFIEYQDNVPKGMNRFIVSKKELSDMLKVDYTSLSREIKNLSDEIEDIESYFSKDKGKFYNKELLD